MGGLFRGGRDTLLGVVLGFIACALLFGLALVSVVPT
jgi:hypothetical protein